MMIKSLTRGRGCVCLLVAAAVEDAVKMKMVKYTHQSCCCFQRGEHVRSEQAKRAGGASGDDGDERNFLETARLLLLLLLLFCSGTFALSPTKRRG